MKNIDIYRICQHCKIDLEQLDLPIDDVNCDICRIVRENPNDWHTFLYDQVSKLSPTPPVEEHP